MVKDILVKSGIYKISAKTEDSRGAISESSEPCFIKVLLGGISIGLWIMSYRTLTLITIIPFILILAGLFYLFWKIRKTRKIIKKETLDLKKKFYKEYNELREDIKRQLEMFKKTKLKRSLTKEEIEQEERLLKNLADVEEVIKKELKDIEEIK